MFGIEFSELLLIGIVALVVIGPERLPRVARTAGHLFGRIQRYVANVKADINREIHAEELAKMRDEIRSSVGTIEQSVTQELRQGGEALHEAGKQVHEIIEIPRKPAEATLDSTSRQEVPAVEAPAPQLELNLGASRDVAPSPHKNT